MSITPFDFDCRLGRQIAFLAEIDKMKLILRQTLLIDGSRRENDAEHSWHLAMAALVLWEYAPPAADMGRVLRMALLHDLVEIDAGDTFAYDDTGNESKQEREEKAADRIFGLLPGGSGGELRALWEEFDAMQTPDALFAAAMDRLQPLIHNYYTDGYTWCLGAVNRSKVYKRMEPIRRIAPALWPFVEYVVEDAVEKGVLAQ